MDRGARWAAVSGITRVEHDWATNTFLILKTKNISFLSCIFHIKAEFLKI